MPTFLHVFTLTVGVFCLLGGGVGLWVLGLVKPTDALMAHGHDNLATAFIAGYLILTAATLAGLIAAVA